jgi:hypothetical protein
MKYILVFCLLGNSTSYTVNGDLNTETNDSNSYVHSERGIVMCSSNKLIPFLLKAIWQIRGVWRSQLGITVSHCGEITENYKDLIHSIDKNINITDLCSYPEIKPASWRIRGFFCKVAALITSPYRETLMCDLDVVWFKNPELLFQSNGYLSTGALYFRDRTYPKPIEKTLIPELKEMLVSRNITIDKPDVVMDYSVKSGVNFFWLFLYYQLNHKQNVSSLALGDFQDSSVVLFDKSRHEKTITVLTELLPSFDLGYGDKEIFWIATTIAGESYTFSPFLAGQYGDCHGVILHYNPLEEGHHSNASPFFCNAEYLVEDITFVGEFANPIVTPPFLATPTLDHIVNMDTWPEHGKRGGNGCTCESYPCNPVPAFVQRHMILLQWATVSARIHWTPYRVKPCVPTLDAISNLLNEAFGELVHASDCPFIGCPHLPIAVNRSLSRPVNARYCDPVSFSVGGFDYLNATDSSARLYSNFNEPSPLVNEALVMFEGSKVVYVYRDGALHSIPNMATLIKMGRDTSEINHLPNWMTDMIPEGIPIPPA